jgi:hypothetical protein
MPIINFIPPTEDDNIDVNQNWIYIKVDVTEKNEKDITFNLNKNNVLIHSNTFANQTREINFTNLGEGNYNYEVRITDKADNLNTITRSINLDLSTSLNLSSNITSQNSCQESWFCEDWNECNNDIVTRRCYDLSQCGTMNNKPQEQSSCEVKNYNLDLEIPKEYKVLTNDESLFLKAKIKTPSSNELDFEIKYSIRDEKNTLISEDKDTITLEKDTIINKWLKTPEQQGKYNVYVELTSKDNQVNLQKQEAFDIVPNKTISNNKIIQSPIFLTIIGIAAISFIILILIRLQLNPGKKK